MAFTKKELIDTLLSSPNGKILAINMVHAVKFGILSKEKASEFILDWWDQYLSNDNSELSFDNLKDSFDAVLWEGEEESKTYLCATQIVRTTANKDHKLFYSIKEYESLYMHPLKGFAFDDGTFLPDPSSPDLEKEIDNIIEENLFDDELLLPSDQRFSPENEVYWICPEKDLEEVFASGDIATRARDFLGLAHIDTDSYMMAVKLKPELLENSKKDNAAVRPTPLDASFHSRFKCLSDKGDHDLESGFTFDFEKQAIKHSNADGGREFVVKESKAIPVTGLLLTPLGKTTSEVDTSNSTTTDFIKRLIAIGGVSEADLSKEFLDLIL